jgi:hypothetical protein
MLMEVLSGEREIPERLRKEGWTRPEPLNGVETARVFAILHHTEQRTEETNLSTAHGTYRTNVMLQELLKNYGFTPLFAMVDAKPTLRGLLKKYFGITPRPSLQKRKRRPTT